MINPTRSGQLHLVPAAIAIAFAGGCATTQGPATAERGAPEERSSSPLGVVAVSPETPRPTPGQGLLYRATLREDAVALLEQAAFSESALIRANAIEGLQETPQRVEPIARSALYDENPGVRFVAAMTFGRLQLAGEAALVERLLDDPDPRVRAAAIYALTKNDFSPDLTALGDMLWHPDRRVRAQAAFILGELGNPTAIPMLRSSAQDDGPMDTPGDLLFRLQVAEAMFKLGEHSASHSILVALYPRNVEDFEASVLAAQILGELRIQESVRQLVNVVETLARDAPPASPGGTPGYLYPPELRLAAATSLAKMGYTDGAYVADEYLEHPSEMIRAQAAFLLAETGRPGDLGKLEGLMGDPDPVVRVAAATSILRALSGDRSSF